MAWRRTFKYSLIFLLLPTLLWAAPPSRIYTYSDGDVITAEKNTANEDAIFNYLTRGVDTLAANSVTASAILDGTITNSDISGTAAIVDTKLAQITTADKVSGAALTGLASIPAGAGALPNANLAQITTADKVSGTALTGLASIPAGAGALPIANGGTGTSTGSITGTGALAFTAGGSNQGITLTPAGNGTILIDNDGTATAFQINQDGVLAASTESLVVYTNTNQTDASLIKFHSDNASSNTGVLYIIKDGTGGGNPIYMANAGTGDSILDDSGAKLTAAGVWTNASSCHKNKLDVRELKTDGFINKLKNLKLFEYKKKIEADKNFSYRRIYKGYILDDPSTPEELIAKDKDGNIDGVSAADGVNFLLAVNKELIIRIENLEKQIEELKNK